jgi:hypothetical protein
MKQHARQSTAAKRWRSGLALAVISCGAVVLSSCGGGATDSSSPVIRGMGESKQSTLSVSNTTLTGTVGTAIALTTSGGSGTGAVTFTVTGTACSVSGTSLNATAAATCIVRAKKAASANWKETTSAAKTFTFAVA